MQFSRVNVNVLPTRGDPCARMFGGSASARVSNDDADQAPSDERPFSCLVDSSPICSAAFLLRIFGIVVFI